MIVATLPNGEAIACQDIPVDPAWKALADDVRAARLLLAEAKKALADYADAQWQLSLSEMDRERAEAERRESYAFLAKKLVDSLGPKLI